MRALLHQIPVDVGSRIPFIRVTDDVLGLALSISTRLPLDPGWKSGSTPAPQTRSLQFVHQLRRILYQDLFQQFIVLFDSGKLGQKNRPFPYSKRLRSRPTTNLRRSTISPRVRHPIYRNN